MVFRKDLLAHTKVPVYIILWIQGFLYWVWFCSVMCFNLFEIVMKQYFYQIHWMLLILLIVISDLLLYLPQNVVFAMFVSYVYCIYVLNILFAGIKWTQTWNLWNSLGKIMMLMLWPREWLMKSNPIKNNDFYRIHWLCGVLPFQLLFGANLFSSLEGHCENWLVRVASQEQVSFRFIWTLRMFYEVNHL